MKKLIVFVMITASLVWVLGFVRLKTSYINLACEKQTNQIGTCARLAHKRSLAGLRNSYFVDLTPTNTGEFEDINRHILVPVSSGCQEHLINAKWEASGLRINTSMPINGCFVDRSVIGQW